MFQTFLVEPIYNTFILLLGVMPGGDAGLAIIAVTLVVRAVFYPAFASSIRTTMAMQAVRPELDEINRKHKYNLEERSRLTMELFRAHRIRPLSSIVALVVQIPVFIALYYVFFHSQLPQIETELLYSFIHIPSVVTTSFLGFVDLLASHNIPVALTVGLLQWGVMKYSLGRASPALAGGSGAAQAMQQYLMLYFFPVLMVGISYSLPSAIALYFAAGNIFSLAQEWFIRRKPL